MDALEEVTERFLATGAMGDGKRNEHGERQFFTRCGALVNSCVEAAFSSHG